MDVSSGVEEFEVCAMASLLVVCRKWPDVGLTTIKSLPRAKYEHRQTDPKTMHIIHKHTHRETRHGIAVSSRGLFSVVGLSLMPLCVCAV